MAMPLFKVKQPGPEHPAYKLGQQLGHRLLARQYTLATWLNQHQFQHGPRVRNSLILGVLTCFMLYFLTKLFAVFTL